MPELGSKNKRDLLDALALLEKAEETKKEIYYDDKQDNGIWGKFLDFVNPFKCGK
jgi:hypothetical protein